MAITPTEARVCPHCDRACSPDEQYCPACGFPIATLKSGSEDRFVGRTLPGGHHILDLISVGGMGRVYRAEQSVLGRTVAVKIIHPHLLSDENSALRFLTEARAASQLNHPNSVAVFDFGRTDDGQPYLVMEFLRGRDLARVSYEEGPLPITRIVDVVRQVLGALGEAHELGIVHRDLKPENIILEPLRRGGDFVKVVDFGLAKLRADAQSSSVTSPGIVCGTPDYMAPEQGRGDDIDGRADLYAVGVILFQMLTSRLPFEAESPTQVVMMHLSLPVPDPRQVAPERSIPDPLAEVVLKALEKDPARRYQAAHELSDALGESIRQSTKLKAAQRVSALPTQNRRECPACGALVPSAKFCGECAAPLPRRTSPADAPTLRVPLALVGRDDDLAWLAEQQKRGQGKVLGVRIVGEHGIGKTRLTKEFTSRRAKHGDYVVSVGPDPYWAEVAYYALALAIRCLAQLSPGDIDHASFGDANPDAQRGLEEIFQGGPDPTDRRSSLERRRCRTEALLWAFRQAALFSESGKVLVVVEDLERMDVPSQHAFGDCLGEACDVLLVATHVSNFETTWRQEHSASRVLSELPLPTAARILSGTFPQLPFGDSDTRGPLPMYVEYLMRYAAEGGSDPPQRLGDLVALRIDTLGPSARRTLQALVVLGDNIERSLLEEMLPHDVDVDDALSTLTESGIVTETDGSISTGHPLVREIALLGIPMEVRRELHERALQLREGRAAPLEARATHAYFAQDSFHALLLLEQVADRATARGDTHTEIFALRRGLEIARQEISRGELDDPLRAVLIFSRKLGASLTRAGNFADAEGVLQEALDVAGPSGADRARVLSVLAQVAHGRRRDPQAVGYLDQAIQMATESGAGDLLTRLRETRRLWTN